MKMGCEGHQTPQHAPKICFKCIVIAHLEHNYSPSHFWAKKFLNDFDKKQQLFLVPLTFF